MRHFMENYLELQENFEKWFKSHCSNLADKTKSQYLFVITSFIKYIISFNVFSLKELSPEIFIKFLHIKPNGKLYSSSSITQRIAALDIFFSWADKNNLVNLNNNPILYYKKNKILPRNLEKKPKNNFINILSDVEQKKLIKKLGRVYNFTTARNHCIVLLILATGLFAEEITTLKNKSVHLKKGFLIVDPTSHRKRKVKINLDICKKSCEIWSGFLNQFSKNQKNSLFFISRTGKKIGANRLYEIVAKILLKAEIKKEQMGPDLLRQTAISNMLKKGSTVDEIKKNTGITSSSQIEKYKSPTI